MKAAFRVAAGALLLAAAVPAAAAPPRGPDVPLPVPRPPFLDGRAAPAPPERSPVPAADRPAAPPPREVQGPPMPPKPAAAHAAAPAARPAPPAPCVEALKTAGAVFEPATIGPQPEPLCIVAEPVRLSGLDPADGLPIDFPDRPTVACATALVFADYLRDLLVPLARGQFGSAVAAIGTGPGFECRTRDHIPGAKISAHGQGLAIDIAELKLANGRQLDIGTPRDEGERAFDKGARAGACGFFHTALGPGADSFHETHWHFDLQPRGSKGDSRICQ
jgi:hypothetical protein